MLNTPPRQKNASSLLKARRIHLKHRNAWIEIEESLLPVLEISTVGLLFQNGRLAREEWCFARLILPSLTRSLSAVIEVVHVDKNHNTLCRFKALLSEDRVRLHDYVRALKAAEAS